jgi:hypothetical protein
LQLKWKHQTRHRTTLSLPHSSGADGVFHCRHLNGNGKIIPLCDLSALSEASGEKHSLAYPHSKAWTIPPCGKV